MSYNIEELSKIYSVSGQRFEDYKKEALLTLTSGKKPDKEKTLIIVGGQSGSGKSRVIPLAKEELQNNVVIVDFDELRALHPNYEDVNNNYSEVAHRILHPDTERVKNEVLKEVIRQGLNVIYEGALRNTQGFLDFAKDFREAGYKIKMYIMAVPKLESYGSTFTRYALAHINNTQPRWVEKSAHDGSYEGVPKTVKAFIEAGMVDDIHVFVRDKERPRRIYTTEGKQFEDPLTAIEYGRVSGRRQAIIDFGMKYQTTRHILSEKEPDKVDKLEDWLLLYEQELRDLQKLNFQGNEKE